MGAFSLFKLLKRIPLSILVIVSATSCSDAVDQLNIEIEPTLGVLGGAVLSTQNTGLVAFAPRRRVQPLIRLRNLIDPFPEAFASCQPVTSGSCLDNAGINTPGSNVNLQVFYNNCQATGMSEPGYWRSYMYLTFESEASCLAVQGAGFTGAGLTAVDGETVLRNYGSLGDDQNNIRLTTIMDGLSEAAYMYSKYDSGWQVNKTGGVEISFAGTTRTINVKGVHAFAIKYESSLPIDPNSYNLVSLSSGVTVSWDHTINTVKTGDTLYEIGPSVTSSGGFGEQENSPTATFDGDAVVVGNTLQKGAVFRIQQNIANSIAVAVVTEDLVYDDDTCCWPSSGVVESQFDRNYPAPTTSDRIEFTGASCGSVRYSTVEGNSARDMLLHCF